MIVYHLAPQKLEFAIGDILQPKTYNLGSFSPKKRQIEEELEKIRNEHFSDYPSRLKCLFVCFDMNDVEIWALQKSNDHGKEFKVLTLETFEPVFWFSAESYNMFFNGLRNDLHQACLEFWESNRNHIFDNMEDREGLTNGPSIIIDVKDVRISRGIGLELIK